jgi:hypothetical protein
LIDGDEFVMAAKKQGLDYNDRQVLNRIVDMVNNGDSVDAAAKKVAGKKYAKGGEVWDKDRPKDLGAPKKLSPAKKAGAKAAAKKAGRPYPNLVDNMRAAMK